MPSFSPITRLPDLVTFCYIDDLLVASDANRPPHLPRILQRLCLVCERSGSGSIEHAATTLLNVAHILPFSHPSTRNWIPSKSASQIIQLVVALVERIRVEKKPEEELAVWEKGVKKLLSAVESVVERELPGQSLLSTLATVNKSTYGGSAVPDIPRQSPAPSSSSSANSVPAMSMSSAPDFSNSPLVLVFKDPAGPAITQSDEVVREALQRGNVLGVHVTPPAVATAIATIIADSNNTSAVLTSFHRPGRTGGWNGKVFAKGVIELNPQLNWSEVFIHLDIAKFAVRDRGALIILTAIFNTAFMDGAWPMSLLYREWRHKSGQLSWLHQIVANPDISCLADHPHKQVNITCLKVQPDDTNKEVANWKVLELTDTLLRLQEKMGDQSGKVLNVFQLGMAACADVLLLALFQISKSMSEERMRLMTAVVPMLLGTHTNAIAVLNAGWNTENMTRKMIHDIILSAFLNHYNKSPDDQSRLTKILEMAHELKPNGLTELFNLRDFAFTVDLACLASKRDFLKLEKWLEDKCSEHGDAFVLAVIGHIRRRLPMTSAGGASNAFQPSMTHEVLANLLSFVQKHATSPATRSEMQHLLQQLQRMQMRESRYDPFGGGGGSGAVPPTGGGGGGGGGTSRLPSVPPASFPAPSQSSGGGVVGAWSLPGFGAIGGSAPFGGGGVGGVRPSGFMGRQQSTGSTPVPSYGSQDLRNTSVPSHSQSMSPSSQMLRSQVGGGGGPPARPSQLPSTAVGGWGASQLGPPAPAMRNTGATTPSAAMDFGRVNNPGQQAMSDVSQVRGSQSIDDISVKYSDAIQTEANSYFEKLYSTSIQFGPADLLNKLKMYKIGNQSREKQVLECVVKNLFDEYKFFPEYPERELRITAQVYGGIIRENIISNVFFATAVRKMIESLNSDVNSMLYVFGIVALDACRTKIFNYPKVCSMISQLKHFSSFPEGLRQYVTAGVNGVLPPQAGRDSPVNSLLNAPQWMGQSGAQSAAAPSGGAASAGGGGGVAPAGGTVGGVRAAPLPNRTTSHSSTTAASGLSYNMANVETLVAATEAAGWGVTPPSVDAQDKVSFLFNNLSMSNIISKRDELRRMIMEGGESFLKWLAQYIVMRRVSIEQNFQHLYSQFLTSIDNPILDKFVKAETFRNIKILLRSDKRQAASNYNERQLLKNLGLWLGSITIAKNKPIVVQDLDLRSLLLEAYYKGQQELLYVIPFIAKILISSGKTTLFSPSCAWMRALLKILAELHNEPDLKINLKFEIEVLCKELSVDLATLPNEGVLKDTEKLVKVPQQLSDLCKLSQPVAGAGSSPIPPQMLRADGMGTPPAPGADTNRSTPVSAEIESAMAHVVGAVVSHPAPVPVAAPAGTTHAAAPTVPTSLPPPTATAPSAAAPAGRPLSTGGASAAGSASATASQETAAQPHVATFTYNEINVVSYEGLQPHLNIAASLPLFQLHPQQKRLVHVAITHAIKEIITPVSERAMKVALTVTESVIKKDFALCEDENQMRKAAHHMMRSMTAAMAAITCREPLMTTLVSYLGQVFSSANRNNITPELQKMIEEASTQITLDNVELTANFIVKNACEKASADLDKRMEAEMEARKAAKRDKRQFASEEALAAQNMMPHKLKMATGPITPAQAAFYDEFANKICGFKAAGGDEGSEQIARPMEKWSDMDLEKLTINFAHLIRDIDQCLKKANPNDVSRNTMFLACYEMRNALFHAHQNLRDPSSVHKLFVVALEQWMYAYSNAYVSSGGNALDVEWAKRLRDLFVSICHIFVTILTPQEFSKRVTSMLIASKTEHRFNVYAVEILVRQNFLALPIYDAHIAQVVDSGHADGTMFATRLLKLIGGNEGMKNLALREHFPKTFDAVTKTMNLIDPVYSGEQSSSVLVKSAGTTSVSQTNALPKSEDVEMNAKVEIILRDWIALCYTPQAQKEPQQALANMITLMHEQGVLATDEHITRFFKVCIELCIDVGYKLLKNDHLAMSTVVRQRCYYTLDAFVKLTCLMVKHSDGTQLQTKINLLKKVLNILTTVLHADHEDALAKPHRVFQSMPYHRMIIIMFNELTTPDSTVDNIAWPILEAFGQAFFILQPRRVPGFAYAWLDIIGHRNVIARLLAPNSCLERDPTARERTAAMYTQLLICHLKFLAPFLRNLELPKSVTTLYRGTLRVLLVILHDFPELLCEYHYVICDAIPPNCVQLRNLILSAYPRNMRLPDPFALSYKAVDSIAEMLVEPKMCLSAMNIMTPELRAQLDSYLTARTNIDFLQQLPSYLSSNVLTPGQKYNTTVVNAVVIYVGMRAIESLKVKGLRVSKDTIAHSAFMDIFQNLSVQLDSEGRYLLFNAIANQLRYPNLHTHYFSCVFLFLFQHADHAYIKEQITRILFERLVALRPHPWGLLITFIELINSPEYDFWSNDFTRCAPEIERLFQNVANTCIVKATGRVENAGTAQLDETTASA